MQNNLRFFLKSDVEEVGLITSESMLSVKLIEGHSLWEVWTVKTYYHFLKFDILANQGVVIENFLAKAKKMFWDMRRKTTDVENLSDTVNS